MYAITDTHLTPADPNNNYGWDDDASVQQKAALWQWTIAQITRRFLTKGTITILNEVTGAQYVLSVSTLAYNASSETLQSYVLANTGSFIWVNPSTTTPTPTPTPTPPATGPASSFCPPRVTASTRT